MALTSVSGCRETSCSCSFTTLSHPPEVKEKCPKREVQQILYSGVVGLTSLTPLPRQCYPFSRQILRFHRRLLWKRRPKHPRQRQSASPGHHWARNC